MSAKPDDLGAWQDRAACRERPGLSFASDSFSQQLVVRICNGCPSELPDCGRDRVAERRGVGPDRPVLGHLLAEQVPLGIEGGHD